MTMRRFVLLLATLFFLAGCYQEYTGTVVDAETGKPVEGAIVLVQWVKEKGLPGLAYHEVEKILEVETDEQGGFNVAENVGISDPPTVVIYKKGYVAWRNDYIFPGWEKREKIDWRKIAQVQLEHFKDEYSRDEHHGFMGHGIIGADYKKTPGYSKARSGELRKALREIHD